MNNETLLALFTNFLTYLSEENQTILIQLFKNIDENYLVFSYVPVLIISLILFEGIRRINKSELVNNIFLILLSCAFIYFIDSRSFFVLLTLAILVFLGIRIRLQYRQHLLLIASIIIISLIGIKIALVSISNPIILLGFSYYYFRLGSVIIENGRGNEKYTNVSAHRFFAYVFFFPIFLSGPVQKLHDFHPVYIGKSEVSKFYFFIVLLILIKLIVLDIFLTGMVISPTRESLLIEMANAGYFLGSLILLFHGFVSFLGGYLDLLIYTQLAITVGRLLGYHVIENFNRPLLATNISDFWRRWHISLSTWARDYIYFPLLIKTKRAWIASYATMLTIGLWHSANLNWTVWALSHGTALNFYSMLKQRKTYKYLSKSKFGIIFLKIVGNIVTISFVSMIYNLVAFPSNYEKSWEIIKVLINS